MEFYQAYLPCILAWWQLELYYIFILTDLWLATNYKFYTVNAMKLIYFILFYFNLPYIDSDYKQKYYKNAASEFALLRAFHILV